MLKNVYNKYKEIINYLIFGFLTMIISLLSYYVLVLIFLNPDNPLELQIANIISWILAVIFAYVTNRKYVFNSNEKNMRKELIKFFSARIFSLLVDMLIMFSFVSLLHFNDKIVKIGDQIIIIIINYIMSKWLVFRKKER